MTQSDTERLIREFDRQMTRRVVLFCIKMLTEEYLDSRQERSHREVLLEKASRLGIETSYYYE